MSRPWLLCALLLISAQPACIQFNSTPGSGAEIDDPGSGGGGGGGGPQSNVSLTDLRVLLHMEEPSWNGTADEVTDSSTFGHHGTAQATATTTASGKFGRGGLFDGASCVEIADENTLDPTDALTYAAWIYPTALDGGATAPGVFAKRTAFGSETAYTLFFWLGDQLHVDLDMEGERFTAPTVFATGQWYHVAVVYDGNLAAASRARVYVNGSLDATSTENSATIPNYSSSLWIGCLPNGGNPFTGVIDEVAIWHRALGAGEIADLASATGPL